jgi:hypothetical protein
MKEINSRLVKLIEDEANENIDRNNISEDTSAMHELYPRRSIIDFRLGQ